MERLAIIGVGQHPNGFFPDKSCLEMGIFAIKEAIANAGIDKEEIDAVIAMDTFADPWYNNDVAWSKLVEILGLRSKCKINFKMSSGGSTASCALAVAAGLINTGKARTVLISHADKIGTGMSSIQEVIDAFSSYGMDREFEAVYGYNQQAVSALVANAYMHHMGITPEAFAAVALSMKKWAALNPNAFHKRVPTLEEILNSRTIASPFTSRMCNLTVDGAEAMIVTSEKNAEKISDKPVFLLGSSSIVTHYSLMNSPLISKNDFWYYWEKVANEAFEDAQLKPDDIDIAEFYDAYPILPLITLEAFGFVEKGKAGDFVMEGNTSPGGSLPMTTNGGMIAAGHTGTGGGFQILIEAVIQLKGLAEKRQVKNANFTVVTESGGQGMDAHALILGGESP